MSTLKQCIEDAGGVVPVAEACGKTPRAIYKWLAAESLPRTDYTRETDYAKRIAALASSKGRSFDAEWLLAEAAPKKSVA